MKWGNAASRLPVKVMLSPPLILLVGLVAVIVGAGNITRYTTAASTVYKPDCSRNV